MVIIKLNDIRIRAFHGVLEQEKIVGNNFLLDVTLYCDCNDALRTDNINDTVSYADIYFLIKDEMSQKSNLLEHVCFRILDRIKKEYKTVKRVVVRITKENPPIGGDIRSASVEIDSIYYDNTTNGKCSETL